MIGEPRFIQERLGPEHDRASFVCSTEPVLQAYLTDDARAKRESDRNISAVYVLLDTEANGKIAGFFTLSNASVIPGNLPRSIAKRLPRYDSWGCVKLGRMARDDAYANRGMGPILVAHAFAAALTVAEYSGFALLVDAKNDRLVSWYEALGFRQLMDRPRSLFIMNATMAAYLERLLNAGGRRALTR
jgi:ribosomal protein S18 acetylase RimI-like enzyme